MTDFVRPPRQEEMQYAGDVLRGKRRWDARIMIAATILGAALGVAIYFAGREDASVFEPTTMLIYMAVVAFCLFIITALALASIRTVIAVCKAWAPARVIAGVACVLYGAQLVQSVFYWILFPSTFIGGAVMTAMGLVFFLLFLTIGLRFIFFIYCMVKGKDDEQVVAEHISADNQKKGQ